MRSKRWLDIRCTVRLYMCSLTLCANPIVNLLSTFFLLCLYRTWVNVDRIGTNKITTVSFFCVSVLRRKTLPWGLDKDDTDSIYGNPTKVAFRKFPTSLTNVSDDKQRVSNFGTLGTKLTFKPRSRSFEDPPITDWGNIVSILKTTSLRGRVKEKRWRAGEEERSSGRRGFKNEPISYPSGEETLKRLLWIW